jgi:putative copper resistance protein D
MSLLLLYVACRAIHFLALMQLIGIAVFLYVLIPAENVDWFVLRTRNLLNSCILLLTFSTFAILPLQSGMMGNGWGDVLRPDIWLLVLTTSFGEVWRWHLLLVATLCLATLCNSTVFTRAYIAMVSTLLLVSHALLGHAADNVGLLTLSHAIHLLATAYWLGGLLPLMYCLKQRQHLASHAAMQTALIRFSRYGHFAVVLVVFSGLLNCVLIMPGWSWNFTSLYQNLLIVKVVLVFLMIFLAIRNRYYWVPQLAKGSSAVCRRIALNVTLVMIIGVVAIILVSLFATLSPA